MHAASPNTAVCRRPLVLVLLALALLLGGCASPLPALQRTPSQALTDTEDTRLGRALVPLVAQHPGVSGFHVFDEPHDAFAARVLLADRADRSIDAQYFIWHADAVGTLMWQALWAAAERGVRVRLLLDDANTYGLDSELAALDAHPNIELRLYNPFVQRGSRGFAYASDFGRLNRRMHNKSFVVDNQASVVGGRNIADEYFGAAEALGFADLDVVAIGPVVAEVSREFDLYWNSASAYPAAYFVGAGGAAAEAALKARFAAVESDPRARGYVEAVRASALVQQLLAGRLDFEWNTAQVLYDDPGKTLDGAGRNDLLLLPVLMQRMGEPRKSIDIVSPYFVPGAEGTAALVAMAKRGVRVRVLTNSLASSDERVVHAGYMKRRHDCCARESSCTSCARAPPTARCACAAASARPRWRACMPRPSRWTGSACFVGSFNFDLRSARLNTEMGLVIDNPVFSADLAQVFDEGLHRGFYEVRIAPDGQNLQWVERGPSGELVVHDVDPETTAWQRLQVGFLAGLPIDWLL